MMTVVCALLTVIILQDFTYKQTQAGSLCQKHVCWGSTFPDLNHFFAVPRTINYSETQTVLLWLIVTLSDVSRKQTVDQSRLVFTNPPLLIHHFMGCSCPPLTSSVSVLACPIYLPLLVFPHFSFFAYPFNIFLIFPHSK